MPDDLKIASLVDDSSDQEYVEYPDIPGFRVLFGPPDNPQQVRIATRTLRQEEAVDRGAEYHYLTVQEYVAGWEGLKVADLPKLLPGKKLKLEGVEETAELAFNPDNRAFLLQKSRPFFTWCNAQVNAREEQEAADSKNS